MKRALLLGLLALALAAGCAQPAQRYLTEAQDAEMRATCEPAGCNIVPRPLWVQIEQLLRRTLGGAGI